MEQAMPVRGARRTVGFDAGRHHRAKIGFVLLAMEQTIESDMFRLAPAGVGLHFMRAPMANRISVETLAAMASGIGDAAALLLPDGDLDVACYACTSGSVVIGEARVFDQLRRGVPRAKPTSLITGVLRALKTLDARRIVVATPYLDEVNAIERDYMGAAGFDILDIEGLNIESDADMVRVKPDYIFDFAKSLDRPEADAIFISCGALRSIEIVDRLEQAAGKPVVASNQAMMWDCLRLAGVRDQIKGYGKLLQSC